VTGVRKAKPQIIVANLDTEANLDYLLEDLD